MHINNFIQLVEEEFDRIVSTSRDLKRENNPGLLEKPVYICEQVQKFRSWFLMSLRTIDVWNENGRMSPEDAIYHAVTAFSTNVPKQPRHPKIVSMINMFDSRDLTGIFTEEQKENIEKAMGISFSTCRFKECFPFCPNFFSDL